LIFPAEGYRAEAFEVQRVRWIEYQHTFTVVGKGNHLPTVLSAYPRSCPKNLCTTSFILRIPKDRIIAQ